MKKTPTIFKRNPENPGEVLNEPNAECAWVFNGEGVATRKYDGSCCKIDITGYWRRREVKPGAECPTGFILEQEDGNTGKRVGWVLVSEQSPSDKYHLEAYKEGLPNGTYELLGPKVQGNPEKMPSHVLQAHKDAEKFFDAPREFEDLKCWMADKDIEGLVFHHPDGRMAKIKKRDFGLRR